MSNSIFVHFLNRELLRSLCIPRMEGADYALKVLLLTKDCPLYLPLSSVWENGTSTDLDYRFLNLVYECGKIQLISNCITIDEFLDRNRQLYYYDRGRYDCYFIDENKFSKFRPIVIKPQGATSSIKDILDNLDEDRNWEIYLPNRDKGVIRCNKEIITNISFGSEGKGITRSLFSGRLRKETDELPISRLLTVSYIRDYMDFLHGDIATGVNNYIAFYDILGIHFPYNDIAVLGAILKCAGVENNIFLKKNTRQWISFFSKRSDSIHCKICELINIIIKECLDGIVYELGKQYSTRVLANELISRIRRNAFKSNERIARIDSINQLEVFHHNLKIILKSISEAKQSKEKKGELIMQNKSRIFIVHGHNELLKEKVANWLYSLELEPIILHKMANGGTRSIIEKIRKYSNVSCAIILLTADDVGRADNEKELKKRARQNVVFEAGYFIGKIGAENVILLYEKDVEIPGDLGGCVYILADDKGGWKEDIRTEFNEMGIDYKR